MRSCILMSVCGYGEIELLNLMKANIGGGSIKNLKYEKSYRFSGLTTSAHSTPVKLSVQI